MGCVLGNTLPRVTETRLRRACAVRHRSGGDSSAAFRTREVDKPMSRSAAAIHGVVNSCACLGTLLCSLQKGVLCADFRSETQRP